MKQKKREEREERQKKGMIFSSRSALMMNGNIR